VAIDVNFRVAISIYLIRIRIQHFRLIRIHYESRILMTKKTKKFAAGKKIKFFFYQKLQFTYPEASIKDVQVTKEAFSSQKRT
jgi:hypothetical protein